MKNSLTSIQPILGLFVCRSIDKDLPASSAPAFTTTPSAYRRISDPLYHSPGIYLSTVTLTLTLYCYRCGGLSALCTNVTGFAVFVTPILNRTWWCTFLPVVCLSVCLSVRGITHKLSANSDKIFG